MHVYDTGVPNRVRALAQWPQWHKVCGPHVCHSGTSKLLRTRPRCAYPTFAVHPTHKHTSNVSCWALQGPPFLLTVSSRPLLAPPLVLPTKSELLILRHQRVPGTGGGGGGYEILKWVCVWVVCCAVLRATYLRPGHVCLSSGHRGALHDSRQESKREAEWSPK